MLEASALKRLLTDRGLSVQPVPCHLHHQDSSPAGVCIAVLKAAAASIPLFCSLYIVYCGQRLSVCILSVPNSATLDMTHKEGMALIISLANAG